MKKDLDQTVVIFRKYKDGDIIALFPCLKETDYCCTCYQHIGQHGVADFIIVRTMTKPATPEEYSDLFEELTHHFGYNLKVQKKASYRKMCK